LKHFQYIATEDGSLTCLDADSGELYHNTAGAYLEALKNYAEPASSLLAKEKKFLRVLDVCFGLGYNTLALLQVLARERRRPACIDVAHPITSEGIAPSPLDVPQSINVIHVLAIDLDERACGAVPKILSQPCFADLRKHLPVVNYSDRTIDFKSEHTDVHLQFDIGDFRTRLRELTAQRDQFDVIFHDPFSPSKVPELWVLEIFNCYYQLLEGRKGTVLTYSSAGCVRGAMAQSGFHVYRTAAVGGKSGGTCGAVSPSGSRNNAALFPLSPDEQARLRGVGSVPYRDPSGHAVRQSIVEARKLEQSNFRKSDDYSKIPLL